MAHGRPLVASFTAATAAMLAMLALRRSMMVVTVDGNSMLPTLRDQDKVLLVRRPLVPVARGSVVVGRSPVPDLSVSPEPYQFMKRVVAVAGEAVDGAGPVVPAGHVWVRGEVEFSQDSDTWGPVPVSSLLGVVLRWPVLRGTVDYVPEKMDAT